MKLPFARDRQTAPGGTVASGVLMRSDLCPVRSEGRGVDDEAGPDIAGDHAVLGLVDLLPGDDPDLG
ncbi:MAG: hypothetical protein QOE71_1053, partial [Pseudonocardiales bacterium]|nr:hypothetical protein [Pseudonocardiales bacterium]